MLNEDSIRWALEFLVSQGDGDLFPKLPEVQAVRDQSDYFVTLVSEKGHADLPPGPCRRFLVPKDDYSYRQATQLDPQDSILSCALIYTYGAQIENRRLAEDVVYSYRFKPTIEDGFYSKKDSWNQFWTKAHAKSLSAGCVLYCDIADFYNQIYHHTIENQLIASNLPNQAIKWFIALFESTTAGVSRGIPIGPHSAHLIAEATLIPIDNALVTHGFDFIRYADDILIFCNDEQHARTALAQVAATLDQQQRLMLQRHKTKIYSCEEFRGICGDMIQDRPISEDESHLLGIIKKYSGGNPYKLVTFNAISPEDWAEFTEDNIQSVIVDYLKQEPVDYIRLRWFYRRLAQVGHPGAIQVSLDNMHRLGPCLANICAYFSSVQAIENDRWLALGERLLQLLDLPDVAQQPFFQLSILSIFSRAPKVNHFVKLSPQFVNGNAFKKREIILAAKSNGAADWLREHKEGFQNMDPWQKMAFIYASAGLPKDEKKYFLNRHELHRPFEKALARWAKNV